jgi:acetyl-CoA synthetase
MAVRGIRNVIVYRRTGGTSRSRPRGMWLHEIVAKQADTCEPEWVGAEHPLFIFTRRAPPETERCTAQLGGLPAWAMLT